MDSLTPTFLDIIPSSSPYLLASCPYTPHLTPYTLHPTSYTLHPTPYTLYPIPYTLHPTPYTSSRSIHHLYMLNTTTLPFAHSLHLRLKRSISVHTSTFPLYFDTHAHTPLITPLSTSYTHILIFFHTRIQLFAVQFEESSEPSFEFKWLSTTGQ